MEVSLPMEFNFNSAAFTPPYFSAPSSPQRCFYSAPTSPSSSHDASASASLSAIPFFWEHSPGVAKQPSSLASSCCHEIGFKKDGGGNSEFDFGVKFPGVISLSADELFDGGKIKPLKPPPGGSQYTQSPISPKKTIVEALSPRRKKKDFDPFAAALLHVQECADLHTRGRSERAMNPSHYSRHKGTRSLSPLRVRDMLVNREETGNNSSGDVPVPSVSSSSSSSWYKRWKIRDLLRFRSASHTVQTKIKTSFLKKNRLQDEIFKESSFSSSSTSTESSARSDSFMGTQGGRPPISAHELLYSASRSFAKEMEMRKGYLLPRKLNLLGCLGFHPTVDHISVSPSEED